MLVPEKVSAGDNGFGWPVPLRVTKLGWGRRGKGGNEEGVNIDTNQEENDEKEGKEGNEDANDAEANTDVNVEYDNNGGGNGEEGGNVVTNEGDDVGNGGKKGNEEAKEDANVQEDNAVGNGEGKYDGNEDEDHGVENKAFTGTDSAETMESLDRVATAKSGLIDSVAFGHDNFSSFDRVN
ncbi:hypothetical protein BTVI_26792 [Pitangus sulphuratus]|nr:hypothetical protein BTVI_26792 [Pitangus sulphuratus]